MVFPKIVKVKGQQFKFIREREHQDLAVYTGRGAFLRIGNPQQIAKEINKHNALLSHSFPLPQILEKGNLGSKAYYIENSLGKSHFGEIFTQEVKTNGRILSKTFKDFLSVAIKYAQAQLSTLKPKGRFSAFAKAVHLDLAIKELPEYRSNILTVFKKVEAKLKIYPFALTHGDFNPHNLYKKGIIDFEHQHHAPAGYDLVTALFNISYFPKSGDYEFIGGYRFTSAQKQQYLNVMDKIYTQNGLPKISPNFKYFGFCRAMWHIARMHKYPKLQQYRYHLFIKSYLK